MPELEVRNLTKRFGRTLAVDDLSFSVEAGLVTGFLGPNGAGKTTTMRALMGLLRPTAGDALVEGRPPVEMREPLSTIGAALEATSFHPSRSGRNHLRALAATAAIPSSRVDEVLEMVEGRPPVEMREPLSTIGAALEATSFHPSRSGRNHLRALAATAAIPSIRVDEVLEMVELTPSAKRRVSGYSLGMRQRLALAAALLGEPRILILDEPANGLDPQGVRWLRDLLRAQAAEGRTVLVSSHLLAEVAQTADRLIVIRKGSLVAETSLDEFTGTGAGKLRVRGVDLTELGTRLTRRGASVENDGDDALMVEGIAAEEIGAIALGSGIALHELAPVRSSLEERFLEVTGEEGLE